MASGKFNRFLEIIGLVDDEAPEDPQLQQYGSGRYGRPSTYIPQRSQNAQPRRTSMNSRASLPSRAGESRSGVRRTYGQEEARTAAPRRTSSRFDTQRPAQTEYRRNTEPDYERTPLTSRAHLNPEAPQRRSRFEEAPAPRREREAEPQQPARPAVQGGGSTVVLNLKTLRDANKVIASLVRGNTIVMTIDTDDPMMRQRIVDTLSGAVYALDATIRRASEQTYLLAPRTVDVQSAMDLDERF